MSSPPRPVTVNITVDSAEIGDLLGSKYVLCLSKSIKDDDHETSGNIIFATVPNDQLAPSMKLTWIEKYQVYQTTSGPEVSTIIYDIDRGQTANFKPDGTAEVTGSRPSLPGNPIVVVNNWKGGSCMGIKVFNTTENPGTFRTFYISGKNPLAAEAYLTPIKEYQIFWATNVTTGDKVPNVNTNPHTFEVIEGDSRATNVMIATDGFWGHTFPHSFGFPEGDSINLTYRNGEWARI